MLCGVMNILSRTKWWIFGPKAKLCKQICITCPYYKICKEDVGYIEMIMGEPWE